MEQAAGITKLLGQMRRREPGAADALVPLVYEELRSIARSYLNQERGGHTLQPTALVHEAYFRLMGQRHLDWRDRRHFFGVAAHLMRLTLIDHARRHRAEARGGGKKPVDLNAIEVGTEEGLEGLLALDEALEQLARLDPRLARVVELRFFCELSVDQVAEVMDVSRQTVLRDWKLARAWLAKALSPQGEKRVGP